VPCGEKVSQIKIRQGLDRVEGRLDTRKHPSGRGRPRIFRGNVEEVLDLGRRQPASCEVTAGEGSGWKVREEIERKKTGELFEHKDHYNFLSSVGGA